MNLIEILNSNGTGMLQGLCRPVGLDSFWKIELLTLVSTGAEIEVVFSLNERNLGKFKIRVSGMNGTSSFIEAKIHDVDDKIICCVYIARQETGLMLSSFPFFASFTAILVTDQLN